MQTILHILKLAGGWNNGLYLKIENPPYMELVIEATGESGPCGLPAISGCHYGEQNGDLMRDPEMCFELGLADGPHLNAFYYRNDYVGVERWSRTIERGNYVYLVSLHHQHERFAKVWDNNLRLQGFSAFIMPAMLISTFRPGCFVAISVANLLNLVVSCTSRTS
jgi:hypothetical protein